MSKHSRYQTDCLFGNVGFGCSGILKQQLHQWMKWASSKFLSQWWGVSVYIFQSMNTIFFFWWCFMGNHGITGMIRRHSQFYPICLNSKSTTTAVCGATLLCPHGHYSKHWSPNPITQEATNHLHLWRGNYFYGFTLTVSSHWSVPCTW